MALASFSVSSIRSADQFGRGVEADDHGFVLVGVDRAVDELDGGFLLELEAVADAVAGVDQDAQAQRQVAFRVELQDRLRLLALDHLEIVLGQVGDEAALLVGDGEQQVDAGDVDLNAGRLVAALLDRRLCWRWPGFCSAAQTTGAKHGESHRRQPRLSYGPIITCGAQLALSRSHSSNSAAAAARPP